ncbi:MAG TPA: hypothetical protein VF472_06655 [Burkholderiaceae bacterium]
MTMRLLPSGSTMSMRPTVISSNLALFDEANDSVTATAAATLRQPAMKARSCGMVCSLSWMHQNKPGCSQCAVSLSTLAGGNESPFAGACTDCRISCEPGFCRIRTHLDAGPSPANLCLRREWV